MPFSAAEGEEGGGEKQVSSPLRGSHPQMGCPNTASFQRRYMHIPVSCVAHTCTYMALSKTYISRRRLQNWWSRMSLQGRWPVKYLPKNFYYLAYGFVLSIMFASLDIKYSRWTFWVYICWPIAGVAEERTHAISSGRTSYCML